MKVLFSVLSYRPTLISEEQINIGVLFHNIDTNEIRFDTISKWNRVEAFDDELDIRYFKIIIKSIGKHISKNNTNFNIESYIKRYNNEIRFSKIRVKETDDFESCINHTKKIFLKFDFEKNQRLSNSEYKQYVRDLLKDNYIEYSSKSIQSTFNDLIHYDYIIGKQAIKIFSFKGKKASNMIFSARAWNQIAKQVQNEYESVFIYDIDSDDTSFDTVINLLKDSNAKLIKLENLLNYINSLETNIDEQIKINGF